MTFKWRAPRAVAPRLTMVLAMVLATAPAPAGPRAAELDDNGKPPLELSLEDAVRMGLENNLDIRIAEKSPLQREQDFLFQEAFFDPNFSAFVQKQDNTSPSINITDIGFIDLASLLAVDSTKDTLFALDQKLDNYNFAWNDPLEWGGSWEASLFLQRQETSSRNALVPVTYFSQFQLAYNQSLLRNFGRDANRTQIEIARTNQDISRSEYRNQVLVSLQQIEDAYWELVFARQDLEVKLESLRLAEELLKLNRIKVEVGTLPPIEITQAEAEVANREQAVIIAENAVGDNEDTLRKVLNMPKEDEAWMRPIVPTLSPDFVEREVDLNRELEEAYANRPDLEQARLDLRKSDTQLAFDKNQLKWDLGFRGTYRLQGLAGDDLTVFFTDPNTGIPTTVVLPINENFDDSLSRLSEADFDSWTAQLTLNIPVGNNGAEATYVNSRLARERSSIAYENSRLAAEVDVRAATRGIQTDRKRIEAAEKNVELQRKKVEAEQKKFENGMSTSFQVLTFQEDLTTALGDKNRALVDYRKSITALEKAKGTLDQYLSVTVR